MNTSELDYKEKQILHVTDVSGNYTINRVTEKAILIECDNGHWIDNGKFIPMWIPKSIISYRSFNDSRSNSQYGVHNVSLPEWFINTNSQKW